MLRDPILPDLLSTDVEGIASGPGLSNLDVDGYAEEPSPRRDRVPRPVERGGKAGRRSDPRVSVALRAALVSRRSDQVGEGLVGSVLWVSDPSAPVPDLPFRVERLELPEIQVSRGRRAGLAEVPVPACVLDGVLEQVEEPASVLAWAYHRLEPSGRLILSVRDVRRARPRKLRSMTNADPGFMHLFPGETLQSLLFRQGFEKPRLRRCGSHLIVSARRGSLLPPPQRNQRLSVIVPAYNEAATFATTMDLLLAKTVPGVEIAVIVVESNSSDGTREKALSYSEHPRVTVILEDRASGKGHAVRTGLAAARGDFVLIQDADMEYDVDDYDALLAPLQTGEKGFVMGTRSSFGGSRGMRSFGQRGVTSSVMNLGHEVFLGLFNVVYGQRLRDPFTMYKVMRRDCLYGLTFECNRFDFDWELAGKLIRAGYHPREIPVGYHSRSFSDGKKIAFVRDPLTWVRACFKYRFVALYPED